MPTVLYGGTPIEYELTRRSVRNLNLRVLPDGRVRVSAPRGVPEAAVSRFVASHGALIRTAREKEALRLARSPMPTEFTGGEAVTLLGRIVPLSVREGPRDAVFFAPDGVTMRTRFPGDRDKKAKLFDRELTALCRSVFEQTARAMYARFPSPAFPFPTLRVRSMTSRWGSCLNRKGVVTLNKKLIEAPPACIEYVALHELAHFVHPDHSPRFHALLTALMPDWKARKKLLEASVKI